MTRSSTAGFLIFAAFGMGVGVGAILTRFHYKAKYERILEEELNLTRHYTDIKRRKQEPEEVAEEYKKNNFQKFVDAERAQGGFEEFENGDDGNPYDLPWDPTDLDYEEEMKHRSDEAPYVISKNEFDNDKPEYEKIDLEYYVNDDVLLDDRIEPLEEVDILVGNANLKRFGHGSGDRRLVYVRNEELETDWEVRLMMGSYVVDVLGYEDPEDQEQANERSD